MKNNTKLSINLNAVALLRNRRNLPWPDIIEIARYALRAGAHGITIHPRPDERHIKFKDIKIISDFLRDEFKDVSFNIEGYPSDKFLDLAIPYATQITLVPDTPEQTTSDHGWDIEKHKHILNDVTKRIKLQKNIIISAFIDSGVEDLSFIKNINIDKIELYTGPYAACYNDDIKIQKELSALQITAKNAQKLNLGVNAGHDLTVANILKLVSYIDNIEEVSIGHGLVADALIYGIENTVKRFLYALNA